MEKREFIINTPLGKLRVWAKTPEDNPADFPGVFIDLHDESGEFDDALACVEYDSVDRKLQTVVYQPGNDEPVAIIKHEMEETK